MSWAIWTVEQRIRHLVVTSDAGELLRIVTDRDIRLNR
jgi:CBS domain-containing protein